MKSQESVVFIAFTMDSPIFSQSKRFNSRVASRQARALPGVPPLSRRDAKVVRSKKRNK